MITLISLSVIVLILNIVMVFQVITDPLLHYNLDELIEIMY